MSKIDARIRYTQQAIRKALLTLLKDTSILKVTVKELCAMAGINRATFYAHYKSPQTLLESIEDDLLAEVLSSGKSADRLRNLFPVIAKNIDLCTILFSENGNSMFLLRMIEKSREQSLIELKAEFPLVPESELEYAYEFIAAGTIAVIVRWVRSGMKDMPKDFPLIVSNLRQEWLGKYLER